MRSLKMPALLGTLCLLGAGSAFAAPVMTVKVPFSFMVRDQVLPPGEYRVEEDSLNPGVLIVRASHGGRVAVISRTTDAPGEDPAGDRTSLVFARDGRTYRLKDVWEDREDGRELPAR